MRLIAYSSVMKFDYEPMPAWGIKEGYVWFRCECGLLFFLGDWTIAQDGTVHPSIDHSQTPTHCQFHEFVKLESYNDIMFLERD